MKKIGTRQVVNIAGLLLVLVVNGLANALPLNGLTTGEISDSFDVFFVPAGYVFSIWGLIYLGLIAFVVYQALPSQQGNTRLQKVGYLFLLSCLANSVWIFLWHYEQFVLTLAAMVLLLLALIGIYLRLDIGRARPPAPEFWTVDIPFSIYLGWVSVATIANITSVLDYLGWGGLGLTGQMWAAIMLAVGVVLGAVMSWQRADVAYLLVLIWAFTGIGNKFSADPLVSGAATYAAVAVGLEVLISFWRRGNLPREAGGLSPGQA